MKPITEKTFNAFANKMASEVNSRFNITPDIIKKLSAPLLFGLEAKEAVDQMRLENSNYTEVLSVTDKVEKLDKLAFISSELKSRADYERRSISMATKIKAKLPELYASIHMNKHMYSLTNDVKIGLDEIIAGNFSSSSIHVTGCEYSPLNIDENALIGKEAFFTFGQHTFLVSLQMSLNKQVFTKEPMMINTLDTVHEDYHEAMAENAIRFAGLISENEERNGIVSILGYIENSLIDALLHTEKNIVNQEMSISPASLRVILAAL